MIVLVVASLQERLTIADQALCKVNVNLVDLMDARRTGKTVKKFSSHKALVDYTRSTNKCFSKERAKSDVVKVLLKQIW